MAKNESDKHIAFDVFEDVVKTNEGLKIKEQWMNANGIKICRFCGSCKHGSIYADGKKGNESIHLCERNHLVMSHDYVCDSWEPSEFYTKAGSSDVPEGKVHSPHYVAWFTQNFERLGGLYKAIFTDRQLEGPGLLNYIHNLYSDQFNRSRYIEHF